MVFFNESLLPIPIYLEELIERFDIPIQNRPSPAWELCWTGQKLQFHNRELKLHPLYGDFLLPWKRAPLGKNDLFAKAMGYRKGIRKVIDATAGLGQDTARLLRLGCSVEAIEKNKILYCLLFEAQERAKQNILWKEKVSPRLHLIYGDAISLLPQIKPDRNQAIFLDPMFPEKNKSALSGGEMQLLKKWQVQCEKEEDLIAAPKLLLDSAFLGGHKRIILKRPLHTVSDNLTEISPHIVYRGKSVRYDVWLEK